MYWSEWHCHRKLLQGHLTMKKKKSCLRSQMIYRCHRDCLEKGQIDAMYSDFEKAFDKDHIKD